MADESKYVEPANNGQTASNPLNYIILIPNKQSGDDAIVGNAIVGTAKIN